MRYVTPFIGAFAVVLLLGGVATFGSDALHATDSVRSSDTVRSSILVDTDGDGGFDTAIIFRDADGNITHI